MFYDPSVSAELLFCEHLSLMDRSQMGNTDLFPLSTVRELSRQKV